MKKVETRRRKRRNIFRKSRRKENSGVSKIIRK